MCPGLIIFFDHILQDPLRHQSLRQHLLELGVFPFEFLQALRLIDVHLAELLFPAMESHLGDVPLLADLHDTADSVRLPQYADLVFRRVAFSFPVSGSFY
jgi:hypothetical protein